MSSLSSWLNSVASKPASSSGPPSASSSSSVVSGGREERRELIERQGLGRELEAKEAVDPDLEEEHQIQLALELSAREDPEAVQIEAVKQISLGPCPSVSNPAEVLAYRYWVGHSHYPFLVIVSIISYALFVSYSAVIAFYVFVVAAA